jgi:sec-independent protein translocase protein TatB
VFGIGWTEFIVIAFVLLIFVGPRQLPAMFRKLGQVIGELKSASQELRNQVSNEVRDLEADLRESVSPDELIHNIRDDMSFEGDSPYDAARRGEAALKRGKETLSKEIQSIKESIEGRDDAPDAKPSETAGQESAPAGEAPEGKKP